MENLEIGDMILVGLILTSFSFLVATLIGKHLKRQREQDESQTE